jgi:hypothetical protein
MRHFLKDEQNIQTVFWHVQLGDFARSLQDSEGVSAFQLWTKLRCPHLGEASNIANRLYTFRLGARQRCAVENVALNDGGAGVNLRFSRASNALWREGLNTGSTQPTTVFPSMSNWETYHMSWLTLGRKNLYPRRRSNVDSGSCFWAGSRLLSLSDRHTRLRVLANSFYSPDCLVENRRLIATAARFMA